MKRFFRSIVLSVNFLVFALGSLFFGFVLFPAVKILCRDKEKRVFIYSDIIYNTWSRYVPYLGLINILKVDVKDIENLRSIKNSVIVVTHPSYFDVLILLSLIPRTTCFVAPKLGKNIFFKNIVSSMFLISGKEIDEMLEDSEKMFERGFNVLVFPSGTRHRKNEYPKIHKGAAMIALYAQKDIVPVKMYTNIDFLLPHQPIYDGGSELVVYSIEVGEKIKIDDFKSLKDEVEMKKAVTKEIERKLYGEMNV